MTIADDLLRSYVERVERLHEERNALSDDIAEVFKEAKGSGFDVKALKEVIRRRSKDQDALDEHEALVDLYMGALGMRNATRVRAQEAAE